MTNKDCPTITKPIHSQTQSKPDCVEQPWKNIIQK